METIIFVIDGGYEGKGRGYIILEYIPWANILYKKLYALFLLEFTTRTNIRNEI